MKPDKIIEVYEQVARPVMLRYWRPDSCIASTLVTMNVLGVFGIKTFPLVVDALLFNRQCWARFNAHLTATNEWPTLEDVMRWEGEDGSWNVGLGVKGTPAAERMWNGHLVAVAELSGGRCLLIDAAIDQGSRPHRGIHMPPVLTAMIPAGFLDGDPLFGTAPEGAMIVYRLRKEPDLTYVNTPDWVPTRHGLVEVGIIRAMRAAGVTVEDYRGVA